ncbi:MAG: hypothetical protein MHMPM18_002022 [Marteilia pararefringens]
MKHFKNTTTSSSDPNLKNVVIIGRKTYMSIPGKNKSLVGRHTFVLSKKPELLPGNMNEIQDVKVFKSLDSCFDHINESIHTENIFIAGGTALYKECLDRQLIDHFLITEIGKNFECDVFLPEIPQYLREIRDSEFPKTWVEKETQLTLRKFSK